MYHGFVTLAEALRDGRARLRAAGIEEAALEAELLLLHALGLSREALFARLRDSIPPATHSGFEGLLQRRLSHEPTAYIVGQKEFYGLELACTPAAIIPRPETELLVERSIYWLRHEWTRLRLGPSGVSPRPLIADVGTGNGAIAVALAANLPEARIIAIDASRGALALARRNAETHRVVGLISFVQGELLTPLRGLFDLIVANLPYVPARTYGKLPPEIREHEPALALHAGRRGTAIIEALLDQASASLQPQGLLVAEHAWNQGRRLRDAASACFPTAAVETARDLAGRERMLVVQTR